MGEDFFIFILGKPARAPALGTGNGVRALSPMYPFTNGVTSRTPTKKFFWKSFRSGGDCERGLSHGHAVWAGLGTSSFSFLNRDGNIEDEDGENFTPTASPQGLTQASAQTGAKAWGEWP